MPDLALAVSILEPIPGAMSVSTEWAPLEKSRKLATVWCVKVKTGFSRAARPGVNLFT